MILVTGGAGFIGSNLVDALLSEGNAVRVLDNLSTGYLSNLVNAKKFGKNFKFIHGDILSPRMVDNAMQGVNCVIHLAAQVSVQNSLRYPVHSAELNINGFLNVLEAAKSHKVPRVIYASSAAVYGHPREIPLSEDSPTDPISPYGLEKLVNEQYARLYENLYGISCLGFRFFNVYGPRQDPKSAYSGVISKFIEKIDKGQPISIFGDGKQTRDFVYVGDVAKACLQATKNSVTGVLCVGTGKSVNLLELVSGIEKVTGNSAEVIYTAPVVGDIQESAMSPAKLQEKIQFLPSIGLNEGLNYLWDSMKDKS